MKRSVVACLAAALSVCVAPPAHAHHSHPYFYDQCRSVTIEGRVERVDWKDPHTLVLLRADDGTVHTVDWNPLSRLANRGIVDPAKAALVPGARITVAGNPIRTIAQIREHFPDYKGEGNPNVVDPTLIRRLSDGWSWARTPSDRMPNSPLVPCTDPARK